jgi:hypothetical protein
MRFAKDRFTGKVIGAAQAQRFGTAFVCPTCHGRVFLRSGSEREPHFAHFSGEGSVDCEEYHPGLGGFGPVEKAAPRVADDAEALGLAVALNGLAWHILLRLPEVPSSEFGTASLAALSGASVGISCGDSRVGSVSALELRPGVALARAQVPPSLQDYSCHPGGGWPAGVHLARWNATTRGLSAPGTIFRLRAGEWTRIRDRSRVEWGEKLVLVADDRCPPPPVVDAEKADGISSAGLLWRLWRISLPNAPDVAVEMWLARMGYEARPPCWRVRFLSVPAAFTDEGPQYEVGVPLVVEVEAPRAGATAGVSLALGTNTHVAQVTAGRDVTFFGEITWDLPGSGTLEVVAQTPVSERFEFIEHCAPVADCPRLRVRIGSREWESWSNLPGVRAERGGGVSIEVGAEGVRLDLVVWLRGDRRRVLTRALPQDAALFLAELLPEATLLEIDASNLGRVQIPVGSTTSVRDEVPARTRLSGWLGAMTQASTGRAGGGQVALVTRAVGQKRRVVAAPPWLSSLARAQERKLR